MVSTRGTQRHQLIKESTKARLKMESTESDQMNVSTAAVNLLPNEILRMIFRICIREYFSTRRILHEPPPAPLHVCRRWRQVAISSPECWTYLAIFIDTSSKTKYTRRRVSSRDTKAKAIQDTLNHYFEWAGNNLVDLRILYSLEFDRAYRHNLMHWLVNGMPRLRSFRENQPWGLFLEMLPSLSTECYKDLVELRVSLPKRVSQPYEPVLMPSLRVLHIPRLISWSPLEYIDCPQLEALNVLYPGELGKLLSTIQRFRHLIELAIHYGLRITPSDLKHESLQRLIALGQGGIETFTYLNSIRHFPNIRKWTLGGEVVRYLDCLNEDLNFNHLESLEIIIFESQHTPLRTITRFWDYFPDIISLSLKYYHLGREFTFSSEQDPDLVTLMQVDNKLSSYLTAQTLLHSLSAINEDGLPVHCQQLMTLGLHDMSVSPDMLSSLCTILRSRQPTTPEVDSDGHETKNSDCLLIFQRSFFASGKILKPMEPQNMSFGEFQRFQEALPST
jgi:hypothetical protein